MITHDSALDTAHGRRVWEPLCAVDFYDPAGVWVAGASQVVGGQLVHDADTWPRTEALIQLPTASTPAATAPPVTPYGGRCTISMGARIGSADYLFQVADLDVVETIIRRPESVIDVRAVSHEARVNEDRYTTRDATAAGTSSAVITSLVRRTLGGSWPVDASGLTSNPTLAAGAYPLDGDVWPTVEAIADAAGAEVFFAADGTLIIRDTPVVGSPVHTLRTGEDPDQPGTLTAYESTRGWAPNRVAVVYTEATGATPGRVVGLWEDTTSTSSVSSGYGRHTRVERISVDAGKLPSSGAANAAAAAIAQRAQGAYRSVTLRAVPAPWLEPGDTVQVVQLGAAVEDLILARVTVPLTMLEPMTLEARDPAYTAT